MSVPHHLENRPLSLDDKPLLDTIFARLQPRISEFTFAGLSPWKLTRPPKPCICLFLSAWKGVVVLVEGKVKAFALGERLNRETSICHFEKADPFSTASTSSLTVSSTGSFSLIVPMSTGSRTWEK